MKSLKSLVVMNLVGLALAACCALARGQEIVIKGDVTKIKVKRIVEIEEDRLLIKSAPFDLEAPDGGLLYRWRFPAGFEAIELGRILQVKKAGKGDATVSVQWVIIDFDKKTVSEKAKSATFIVGEPGPQPPGPLPPDPPKPPDPVDPPPFQVSGLAALIVYETAEISKHPGLSDVMSGAKTNDYMAQKGIKGGFVKLDKDSDVSGLPRWMQDAFIAGRDLKLPVIVISNGKSGYIGPVPNEGMLYSPNKTLELLKKYEPK